ncbi:unnamed protein product [Sphagnum balticum]
MAQIRVSNKREEVRPQVPRFAIGCVDAPVVVHVCAVQPTIHFSATTMCKGRCTLHAGKLLVLTRQPFPSALERQCH